MTTTSCSVALADASPVPQPTTHPRSHPVCRRPTRPAEAVGLVETDLILPEHGWGSALLHRTRPSVGKQWTDSGETHDDRGLKNRPTEDVRRVPIPPHLVAVLREHLVTFGTAEDGRLFFTEKGAVVPSST